MRKSVKPVLKPDVANKWECSHVLDPAVVYDEETGRTHVWYGAITTHNDSVRRRVEIGYAWGDGTDVHKPDDDASAYVSGRLIRRYPTLPVFTPGIRPAWKSMADNATGDLDSFTSVRMSVGAFDDVSVYGPSIIKRDGRFHMWYTGWAGDWTLTPDTAKSIPTNEAIGYAWSADGITWHRAGDEPKGAALIPGLEPGLTSSGVSYPTVVAEPDGAGLRMWYQATTPSGVVLCTAMSRDGVRWLRQGAATGIGEALGDGVLVDRPVAWTDDSGYRMAVRARRPGRPSGIHLLRSTDGQRWTADAGPAVQLGEPGSWDDLDVYPSCVVTVGSRLVLWYTAFGTTEVVPGGADWAYKGYLRERAPMTRYVIGVASSD